jgi:hypothetical protein
VFKSEVRPVEVARKLTREMDEHKTESLSRTYVPNEYIVYLSADDRSRLEGVEDSLVDELSAYLLEHARRERLALLSTPQIEFRTDERLSLGEFGIQTRLVRPPEEEASQQPPQQASHGNTMIYSTAGRIREEVAQVQGVRSAGPTRALLVAEGRRHVVPPSGGLIGRSRECDVVLADANVSRRHAEIRPSAEGWTIADLGSTNGVLVNGRRISGAEVLRPGDRIALGTADIGFEVE